MPIKLIADSGATKAEWCLINGKTKKTCFTQGLSPYFLSGEQIQEIIGKEVKQKIGKVEPDEVWFYGTGLANPENAKLVKKVIQKVFKNANVSADHDLMGAARALCGREKGMTCNLGTGSFACYYDGKKIVKSSPGIGYILGDEGSGAYLGKKVIQYYLYNTFDEELRYKFDAKFATNRAEILDNVYKKPLANRYLASYAIFLAENRGHYMIENIIEDGLNDFFFNHIYKYRESWTLPIHFTGSVAYGFRDVLKDMCSSYELQLGKVIKKPMDGLVKFHR